MEMADCDRDRDRDCGQSAAHEVVARSLFQVQGRVFKNDDYLCRASWYDDDGTNRRLHKALRRVACLLTRSE